MDIADNNDGYVEEDALDITVESRTVRTVRTDADNWPNVDIYDETDFRVKRSHVDMPDFPYIRFVADDSDKPYEA